MADDLKAVFEGHYESIKEDPSRGIGTAVTRIRIRDGVTCEIEDGDWKLIADEMPGDGGAGLGPDPGVFGRAALGTCLAMGYAMWAAHRQIPIDGIEVVVEADYDARGQLALDDSIPPGWTGLRYRTIISSPAPEDDVRKMVDMADRYSSLLDDFRRPHDVKRELVITKAATAGPTALKGH
jgi:uncharacterized OsmC-like protein